MKNLIMAWRNLWRKPWRTIITSGSVFFGVLFTAFMTSMQFGSYESMIDNVVKFYSGYMQIFTEEYHENKTINNTFEMNDSIRSIVENEEEITHFTPRLEYFALASTEEKTKGAVIIGIDPGQEKKVTNLDKWLGKIEYTDTVSFAWGDTAYDHMIRLFDKTNSAQFKLGDTVSVVIDTVSYLNGEYLEPGDDGVLIATDLADYLQIQIGDTLVLYGQGYHGVMAAGLFPIKGILKFPSPELNKQLVYMELSTCQEFFSAPNRLTSLVMMVKDHYHLPAAMRHLSREIKSPYMVMSWAELQPELVSMIEGDRAGGVVMKGILYMIITFGIFGTILMMMSERSRELGVMIAIGMQRFRMGSILFLETLYMGFLGAVAGIAGSIPLAWYFYKNPIPLTGDAGQTMIDMGIEPYMYFSMQPEVFYTQALIVFIITLIIALFPIYKSFTIKLTKALRA